MLKNTVINTCYNSCLASCFGITKYLKENNSNFEVKIFLKSRDDRKAAKR